MRFGLEVLLDNELNKNKYIFKIPKRLHTIAHNKIDFIINNMCGYIDQKEDPIQYIKTVHVNIEDPVEIKISNDSYNILILKFGKVTSSLITTIIGICYIIGGPE